VSNVTLDLPCVKASYPAQVALSRRSPITLECFVTSMTRKRFDPRVRCIGPAGNRRQGEGVRTAGIRASGQVDAAG
jgi:hypothetical protein